MRRQKITIKCDSARVFDQLNQHVDRVTSIYQQIERLPSAATIRESDEPGAVKAIRIRDRDELELRLLADIKRHDKIAFGLARKLRHSMWEFRPSRSGPIFDHIVDTKVRKLKGDLQQLDQTMIGSQEEERLKNSIAQHIRLLPILARKDVSDLESEPLMPTLHGQEDAIDAYEEDVQTAAQAPHSPRQDDVFENETIYDDIETLATLPKVPEVDMVDLTEDSVPDDQEEASASSESDAVGLYV